MRRVAFPRAGLVAWLSFVVAAWLYSEVHTRTIIGTDISITAWPRGLLVALTICLVLEYAANTSTRPHAEAPRTSGDSTESIMAWLDENLRLLAAVGVVLVYLLLLPRIGFYIATWPLMAGMMAVFGIRSPKHVLITAPLCLAVIVFVFTRLLFVPLPTGNWQPFYEFNVWIVEFVRNLGAF